MLLGAEPVYWLPCLSIGDFPHLFLPSILGFGSFFLPSLLSYLELDITEATTRWALLAAAAAARILSYDSGDIGTTKYETQYGA